MKFAANLNLKEHQFFFTHPVQSRLYHESTYHHENKACSIPLGIKNSKKNPVVLMYA